MNWSDINNPEEWKFTTPIPNLRKWSSVNKDSLILDIGCGYGRTLRCLSDDGFTKLYGIDVSPRFISQARQLCPNAHLLVGDCRDISSLYTQKFDVILVMGVIEYILSDQQQNEFFLSIKQMLSPNGIAIFETFTMDWKNNYKQYLMWMFRTGHIGLFRNSKGFMCHHQTPSHLHRAFDSIFPFVIYEEKKYCSWTNNHINGMNIIASNHELRKIKRDDI